MTKRRKAAVILIVSGTVVLTGTLLIRSWWNRHVPQFLEQGRAVMEEGRTFGRTATAVQCIDEAVRRLEPGEQSFTATLSLSLFFDGCLQTGAQLAELCASAPGQGISDTAMWMLGLCQARGRNDRYCPRVIQPLSTACRRTQGGRG